MKTEKTGRTVSVICLAFLVLMMGFVLLRMFTRAALTKRGISNTFTELVNFDAPMLKTLPEDTDIDWQALYPFPETDEQTGQEDADSGIIFPLVSRLNNLVLRAENTAEPYVTEYLVGYRKMTEAAKYYENLIGWNYAAYDEYNGVLRLEDGYLTGITVGTDPAPLADSVLDFAAFCEQQGCSFLYVQTPNKLCALEDPELSGVIDHSNQNEDEFLATLENSGVQALDLRSLLHEEGLNHHAQFYRTDHHWKSRTALWASERILDAMRSQLGLDIPDENCLSPERFTETVYPDWFLGSQGKKVTLAVAAPEDFSLLYPDYPTSLRYSVPARGIDTQGDFSVTYDLRQLEVRDYYNSDPYLTFNYGNQPLIRIENLMMEGDLRILLLHDSFGDSMLSFLSLGVRELDAIDLRLFTGSVHAYIEAEKPDAVICLYSYLDPMDLTTHTGLFDFR